MGKENGSAMASKPRGLSVEGTQVGPTNEGGTLGRRFNCSGTRERTPGMVVAHIVTAAVSSHSSALQTIDSAWHPKICACSQRVRSQWLTYHFFIKWSPEEKWHRDRPYLRG